jgi:hypothetical protein
VNGSVLIFLISDGVRGGIREITEVRTDPARRFYGNWNVLATNAAIWARMTGSAGQYF